MYPTAIVWEAFHGTASPIVVMQDLFGLSEWQPSFARPITSLGDHLLTAAQSWRDRVARSDLGDHPYHMTEDELSKWR